MAKITFITRDEERITLEADSGTVMELAVQNRIQGIYGDCGGVCSCATCHVYVEEEFYKKLGEVSEIEEDLLDLDELVMEYSRLSCQLEISPKLDGLVMRVANT